MPYKLLPHTADLKIAVEEKSLEEAFRTSAGALRDIAAENSKIKSVKSRIISVEGKDLCDLLYNFLEEFIYLLDAEGFVFSEVEDLEIFKGPLKYSLSAKVLGDRVGSYKFVNKVKAVTFNDMKVIDSGKAKIEFVLDV